MVEFEETPFGTKIIGLKEDMIEMLKPFEKESEIDQLRARNAELEVEVARLRKAINVTHLMLLEGKYGSATIEIGQALEASDV